MGGRIKIKEADIHITTECGSCCDYCYVDPHEQCPTATLFKEGPKEGDTYTLKRVISNLRRFAGVEDLVFVGGDPCAHSNLVKLMRHAKVEGLNVVVLSNTHQYFDGGEEVSIETVAHFIDEMDWTLHGPTAEKHNAFNKTPGSYQGVADRIKRFMAVRTSEQSVGIILNMVLSTIGSPELLHDSMKNAINELGLVPEQDFFTIQRIAPSGKALLEWRKWMIDRQRLADAFGVFDQILAEFGIETKVCIDAIPWCALPEKYWHYLEPLKGGCNWGQPNGVLSVLMDGRLQRCALCKNDLSVNILNLHGPHDFTYFMEKNTTLCAIRERRHLADTCLQCPLLEKCGGGCIIANTDGVSVGDPYGEDPTNPRHGVDYLADPQAVIK